MKNRKEIQAIVVILISGLCLGYWITHSNIKQNQIKVIEKEQLTTAEKVQDFDYLLEVLQTSYPFLEEETFNNKAEI